MRPLARHLNFHVTAFAVLLAFAAPLAAQEENTPDAPPEMPTPSPEVAVAPEPEGGRPSLDQLFAELSQPEQMGWQRIEDAIWIEWSRSGSASMDLLLKQGREALERQDYELAIEHLTALTDHAPEFAEGFNARATAFFQLDEYGLALEDIRRTLELNPRHFAALTGLAVIMEQMGEEARALTAYQEVLKIHPHRPNVKEAVERLEFTVLGKRI